MYTYSNHNTYGNRVDINYCFGNIYQFKNRNFPSGMTLILKNADIRTMQTNPIDLKIDTQPLFDQGKKLGGETKNFSTSMYFAPV